MNPDFDCKGLDMIPVVKSEIQYNQLEPEFEFTKKMVVFCGGDKNSILKFTIKKAGQKKGDLVDYGFFTATLELIMQR